MGRTKKKKVIDISVISKVILSLSFPLNKGGLGLLMLMPTNFLTQGRQSATTPQALR